MSAAVTIMRKELREIQRSVGPRGGVIRTLLVTVVLGALGAISTGAEFLGSPYVVFIACSPAFMVASWIPDSFAGERERHTLETLLSAPVTPLAIMVGKAAAAVSFAMALGVAILASGLFTTNLIYNLPRLEFFDPVILLSAIAAVTAMSSLLALVGVIVSLRAPTVRSAQQQLGIVVLILMMGPAFGWQFTPLNFRTELARLVARMPAAGLAASGIGVWMTLIAVLGAIGCARFQRHRLVER